MLAPFIGPCLTHPRACVRVSIARAFICATPDRLPAGNADHSPSAAPPKASNHNTRCSPRQKCMSLLKGIRVVVGALTSITRAPRLWQDPCLEQRNLERRARSWRPHDSESASLGAMRGRGVAGRAARGGRGCSPPVPIPPCRRCCTPSPQPRAPRLGERPVRQPRPRAPYPCLHR